ncbi:MAG: phosphotransferase family protein [Rhizobiales bacterium]|nr:phosphotransferase family protein [Hyphomicrobiales bacterium]
MSAPLDRQKAFAGTQAVSPAHHIDKARLSDYLKGHIEGFDGPLQIEQFKGGQSNPTYKLTTPGASYVLRRKPPGKLLASAHAVDREFRIMSALADVDFPVPRPLHLCTDDAVIGSMFFVMTYVPGRVFWYPWAPGLDGRDRAALFNSLNETIARLHNFDPAALGLGDYGRPQGYVARQIRRWSEQYRASETRNIPAMERLIEWLPGACPADQPAAIIHGDFRLDNCIIDLHEPRVVAVLDWELSTLGDPVADFTYHLMQWHMPASQSGAGVGTLKGHEKEPGLPALADYVEAYCCRTGRAGIENLDAYLAYNFFRIAAILQGIAGRVRDGTAANAHAAAMASQVEPLAETGWGFAMRAGA